MGDSTSHTDSDDTDIDAGSKKTFLWAKKDSYGYTSGIEVGLLSVCVMAKSR